MAEPKLTLKQRRFIEEYLIDFNAIKSLDKSGHIKAEQAKKYYVYLLINPITNKIFYVGKGKGKRIESHVKRAKMGLIDNEPKYTEIMSIINTGLKPIEFIFQDNMLENNAFMLEGFLIKSLKEFGLTNISSGTATNTYKSKVEFERMISRLKPFDLWVAEIHPESLKLALSVFGDLRTCYNTIKCGLNDGLNIAKLEIGAK